MASEAYWNDLRQKLAESPSWMLAPIEDSTITLGNGPFMHVSTAFDCMLAGLQDLAFRILDNTLPRLRHYVKDLSWLKDIPLNQVEDRAFYTARYFHLGSWIRTGVMDCALAQICSDRYQALLKFWNIRRPRENYLLESMLLRVESRKYDEAAALYEEYEKKPIAIPPPSRRFTRNARSILYLFLKSGRDESQGVLLQQSLSAFLSAATRWGKDAFPLPYTGEFDVARIFRACRELAGGAASMEDVLAAVR